MSSPFKLERSQGPANLDKVKSCDVFFFIARNAPEEVGAERIKELNFAKELGKPIAIIVWDDVDLSPLMAGAEVVETLRLDSKKHIDGSPLTKELVHDFKERTYDNLVRRRR